MKFSPQESQRPKLAFYCVLAVAMTLLLIVQGGILFKMAIPGITFPHMGITDLGRDLVGAHAVEKGGSPYGKISDLQKRFGALSLPQSGPAKDTLWVAHPPLAIACARHLLNLFGAEKAEIIARRIGLGATLLLSLVMFIRLYRRGVFEAAVAAWCVIVWTPALTDLAWIQDNAVAALILFGVLVLDGKNRRTLALILLGVLAAWKPWTAVFTLALPRSTSAIRDVLVAGCTAAVVTMGVLPFIGGIPSLWDWLLRAMPENLSESRSIYVNISWTKWFTEGIALSVYSFALAAILVVRRRLPRNMWPAVAACAATTLAPLVWDAYWVAVSPAVGWMILVGPVCPAFGKTTLAAWATLAILPIPLEHLGVSALNYRPFLMASSAAALLGMIIVAIANKPALKRFF